MPLQFQAIHVQEALHPYQSLHIFHQRSKTGLHRQVLAGTPDDQVLERPHGQHISMCMGHLPRRVDVDLAQQMDVPRLAAGYFVLASRIHSATNTTLPVALC